MISRENRFHPGIKPNGKLFGTMRRDQHMKRSAAEIIREYGPFPGVDRVNGVTYDGR